MRNCAKIPGLNVIAQSTNEDLFMNEDVDLRSYMTKNITQCAFNDSFHHLFDLLPYWTVRYENRFSTWVISTFNVKKQ